MTHVIRTLTHHVEGVQAIVLRGSQQNPQSVDMWSDYDLLIVLNPSTRLDERAFLQAVDSLGPVVGCKRYQDRHTVLYRAAAEFGSSIQLLDTTVRSYREWLNSHPLSS